MRLLTSPPFHLEATVRVLQRRPVNLVDRWDGSCYRRVLSLSGRRLLVQVRNRGPVDRPELVLKIQADVAGQLTGQLRTQVAGTVRRMLGLDLPIEAVQARLREEPRLQGLAGALRGMRPPCYPDLFEAFGNVVPFQQVSIDAGVAVVSRLVKRFGGHLEVGGRRYAAFPGAATIARCRTSSLRACGLSWQKAETLRDIARRIDSGILTSERLEALASKEAVTYLIGIPGIGRWSAAVVLLRGMGRLEVFPPGDSGAIGSLLSLLRLRSPVSVERIIRQFDGWRGYLYFCGIGGRLLARGLIRPAAISPLQFGGL